MAYTRGVEPEARDAFVTSLMGERIAGRYLVDRLLGHGGMGMVAAARYPELAQDVAIKFMYPEHASDATLTARFLREARLAAQVKSPHFVRVYDIGNLESGVPYLVMERLAGWDLSQELAARGALPVEEAVDFVLQATVGIAEVHALGVVHRDLKPSNLFLAEAAGTRTLKVLDFGVSKEKSGASPAGAGLTSTNNFIGTPQYMSPEQIRNSKDVDYRSDIWALGVILYELLTANVPFSPPGGGAGELFGMILYVDPVPPTKYREDLAPDLAAVIMKCLQREASDRYQSVADLADALRAFAAPHSLHRIQAAKRALVTSSPTLEIGEVTPLSSLPTIDDAPAHPPARGKQTVPERPPIRDQVASAPTVMLGQQPPRLITAAPVTSHTDGGRRSKKNTLALVALGAAATIGMVTWVAMNVRSAINPDAATVTNALPPPMDTTQALASAASAAVTAATNVAASGSTAPAAVLPTAAPSAVKAAVSAAPGAAAHASAPAATIRVRPPVTTFPGDAPPSAGPRVNPTPPAPTVKTPTNAFDLLQDRK